MPWAGFATAVVLLFALLGCKGGAEEASSTGDAASKAAEIRVGAASDLQFAFTEIGKKFEAETGTKVTFVFGSTGNLAKQLKEGAPFDVFAAANVAFVDDVVAAGACHGDTKALYGRGRIVLWSRKDATDPARALSDLTDARFKKIAIANPEHAPYGKAAKEALESAGLWETVQPKLVFGENVSQTLQFGQTGNAEAAIVALSLALADEKGGQHALIDESGHEPLDQALVVCKSGLDEAAGRKFTAYVTTPPAREIMNRFGFVLPGEAVAGSP